MRGNVSWTTLAGVVGVPLGILCVLYKVFTYRSRVKLKDKVVLITGATSGVGKACAAAFFKAGCHVILASRNTKQLQSVQEQLENLPSGKDMRHPPKYVDIDLEDLQSIANKAKQVLAIHGRVDVLINNAGISCRGSVEDTSLETDMRLMTVNYFGHVALTKALLPSMLRTGGHIVAVSSIQGKIAIPYRSSYAASKHALQAFFDSMRAEVADRNVHICVVSPGYIRTSLSINALCGDGSKYGQMEESLAKGMSPESVADKIMSAVIYGDSEVIIGPVLHRTVCYLRNIVPNIFFRAMQVRAKNEQRQYLKKN
ncbi:hypothetical protein ScPMuIL_004667 [Solemya velum]